MTVTYRKGSPPDTFTNDLKANQIQTIWFPDGRFEITLEDKDEAKHQLELTSKGFVKI